MGHCIEHYDYPDHMDKKAIENRLSAYVEQRCYQEGGQMTKIRWLDTKPFSCYDEAEQHLKRNDTGWYDCLAVRYRQPKEESDTLYQLKTQLSAAYKKFHDLSAHPHFAEVKAVFVTCKGCGSKISRIHLLKNANPNSCPVCHADMRPKSTMDAIEKAEKQCKRIEVKVKEEEIRLAKKGEIRWLVKIEYHQ